MIASILMKEIIKLSDSLSRVSPLSTPRAVVASKLDSPALTNHS